jgi:hypothetical protein
VVVLPATCKRGRHMLAATGFRAVEQDGELHISCIACGEGYAAAYWRLSTKGPSAGRAELDDEPYVDVRVRRGLGRSGS